MNIEDIRLTPEELIMINHPWAREMETELLELEYDRAIANTATDKAIKKIVWGIEERGFYKDDISFIESIVRYVEALKKLIEGG